GCGRGVEREAAALTKGDPGRGKDVITRHGCSSCHQIPGIGGTQGLVGPSLKGIANRSYVAGTLVNTPENMIRWIQNPQAVDQNTATPNLGLTAAAARDVAAYLYTLK